MTQNVTSTSKDKGQGHNANEENYNIWQTFGCRKLILTCYGQILSLIHATKKNVPM